MERRLAILYFTRSIEPSNSPHRTFGVACERARSARSDSEHSSSGLVHVQCGFERQVRAEHFAEPAFRACYLLVRTVLESALAELLVAGCSHSSNSYLCAFFAFDAESFFHDRHGAHPLLNTVQSS